MSTTASTAAHGSLARMKLEHLHQPAELPELRFPFDGCNLVDVRKTHERADTRKRWPLHGQGSVANRVLRTVDSLGRLFSKCLPELTKDPYEQVMTFLCPIHEFWCSMVWDHNSGRRFSAKYPNSEAHMIVNTVMIVLCTAAVAFYARFLMALCKESRSRSTGYWVRLRLSSPEDAIAERQARKKPVARAA